MRHALLPALLLLVALAPAAQALEAGSHTWSWRFLDDRAQVEDALALEGPGAALRLDVPGSARDVQAFVNGAPAPWAWVGPRTLEVELPAAVGPRDARVRYVLPLPATGLAVERTIALPTRQLTLALEPPAGWAAEVDGRPLGRGDLGSAAEGRAVALRVAPIAEPSPLVVLGVLTAAMLVLALARAATAKGRELPEPMGLLDHLRELQVRLRVIVIAVAVLMLVLFTFSLMPVALGGLTVPLPLPSLGDTIAAQTFRLVAQQFVPPGVELVVVDPISGALVQVEVALFLAVLVASPLIAMELGTFLMPALTRPERRVLLRAVPAATGLFFAGALFAYLVLVPTMMRVLYGYAEGLGARPLISVDSLVSFAVIVTLLFGLAFELPLVMVALAWLGVAAPQGMARAWRHVVLGIFVLAAIITPDPSVVSQVLVALPLLVLYGVGLVAARAVAPARPAAPEGPAPA